VTEKVISICLCGWIKREPTSTFYPVVNTDSLSTFRGEFHLALASLMLSSTIAKAAKPNNENVANTHEWGKLNFMGFISSLDRGSV